MHESMLYKLNEMHIENPDSEITTQVQSQNQEIPKNFKQNTKDFFDTNEDNLLGNLFEDN